MSNPMNFCNTYDVYGYCPVIGCKFRHYRTNEEIEKIALKEKEEKEMEEKSENEEQEKFIIELCKYGKDWQKCCIMIRKILNNILSDPIILLIAHYHINENLRSDIWSVMSGIGNDESFWLRKISNLSSRSNLLKRETGYCYQCNNKHYNYWVSIIKQTDNKFIYQIICVNCLPLEYVIYKNGSHIRTHDGKDPIWISENGKPLIDWKENLSAQLNDDGKITANNNSSLLRMFCINENCRLCHIGLFDVDYDSMITISHGYPGSLFID